MDKTVAYAYFEENEFKGWWGRLGKISTTPRLYLWSESQEYLITEEFRRKASKDGYIGVVECPFYQGPHPDFKVDEHNEKVENWYKGAKEFGVVFPLNSEERWRKYIEYKMKNPIEIKESWIYVQEEVIKDWGKKEPREFLKLIL